MTRRLPDATARPRLRGWALAGLALGIGLTLILKAPASWMGMAMSALTQDRVRLQQARGTLWQGDARLALGAGPDSPGSVALPGRLRWRLTLEQNSALRQEMQWLIVPGWNRSSLQLDRPAGTQAVEAHIPAAWLSGLGAPWNTLKPSGRLVLQIETLQWETAAAARPVLSAAFKLHLQNVASRVTTLPVLGHYELDVRGSPDLQISLNSRPGSALILEGAGRWKPGERVEFRGQATAAAGREEALSNLLNIIGRRDGERSIIALSP